MQRERRVDQKNPRWLLCIDDKRPIRSAYRGQLGRSPRLRGMRIQVWESKTIGMDGAKARGPACNESSGISGRSHVYLRLFRSAQSSECRMWFLANQLRPLSASECPATITTESGTLLGHIPTNAIGPAMCAGAPSDEGIDRYFSVGFVSPQSPRRRATGRSVRMTLPGRGQSGSSPARKAKPCGNAH
jgi:hypothetical protein